MKIYKQSAYRSVRWVTIVSTGFVFWVTAISCGEDNEDEDDVGGENEYVAELKDFAGFEENFDPIDYTIGDFHEFLSSAHMSDIDSYSRASWINSVGAAASGGAYPIGTIVVKETYTWMDGTKKYAEEGGLLAMVKRGGTFNSAHNNWEWFVLKPDVTDIVARGGDEVMEGGCNSCHANATGSAGMDYVFTHPAEFASEADDFTDYSTWTLVGENTGADPVLGSAHGADTLRKTYRKSALGKPVSQFGGYPIGTIIAKEVIEGDQVVEIAAMVKRGGDFNPDHGSWEWLVIDPETGAISNRGADLMGGACNSCHSQALNADHGQDYVFKHDNDLFNN